MTINVLPVNQNFNDHGLRKKHIYCEFGIPASTYYYKFSIGIEKKMPGMYIAYSAVNQLVHKTYP